MKHLKGFEVMNEGFGKNLNFEQIINSSWSKGYADHGPSVTCDDANGSVILTLEEQWDEFYPIAHAVSSDSDFLKLYNLLFYSKDMYKLIKEISEDLGDNEYYLEAKEIMKKIDTDKNLPQI